MLVDYELDIDPCYNLAMIVLLVEKNSKQSINKTKGFPAITIYNFRVDYILVNSYCRYKKKEFSVNLE
jgi:hypothetical protein